MTSTLTLLTLLASFHSLKAEGEIESPKAAVIQKESVPVQTKKFEAFTGRVTKNKVRVRLQPHFDAAVFREVNRKDMLVITDETDDFYSVQPPADTKGYVYRTYVLDNVVEGKRVNVRLKPDLDAPVITQLNSGDRVNGTIDSSNNKWLEIDLPPSTHFYISKDYIEKAGDANLLARTEQRREEATRLLKTTESIGFMELHKPYHLTNVDGIIANYKKVIDDYQDFPQLAEEAKTQLSAFQDAYTNKKIAYLENQANQSSKHLEIKNKQLADELQAHKHKLSSLEQQIKTDQAIVWAPNEEMVKTANNEKPKAMPLNMSSWIPIEEAMYNSWARQNLNQDQAAFYQKQKQESFILKGIVEPYTRPVKNRPGDHMLLNPASKLPVAFLYSTQINLQDYIGHEVAIRVARRPNNDYAFPAYYVLSVE